jgi:23S rRNA U2552 (ribose-2'-O)-methylase RlmE/FtsJ
MEGLSPVESIVSLQFLKCFRLGGDPISERLPASETWFTQPRWQDPLLQTEKADLNRTKSQLDSKPLQSWSTHTRRHNPAKDIAFHVKKEADPELATQAWCKMTECLHRFGLLDSFPLDEGLVTVHLCEAPGAFVSATNHFLATRPAKFSSWHWRATSLNPFHEGNSTDRMVNDDTLILHSLDRWMFGEDATGDLLGGLHLGTLCKSLTPAGLAHLVTADGGVDCQREPWRQEEMLSQLLRAETSVALSALRPGGNLVLKMFTLFEDDTVCLLLLLKFAFDTLDLYKPASSKEGNSEVYAICKSYRGNLSETELQALALKTSELPLFGCGEVPPTFLEEVRKAAGFFSHIQRAVITRNLLTFEEPIEAYYGDLSHLQDRVAEEYLRRFRVVPLHAGDRLLGPDSVFTPLHNFFSTRRDSPTGTLGERKMAGCRAADIEKDLLHYANPHRYWIAALGTLQWCEFRGGPSAFFEPEYGREADVIRNSKFCPIKVVHILQQAHSLWEGYPTWRRKNAFATDPGPLPLSDLPYCQLAQRVWRLLPEARDSTWAVAVADHQTSNYLREAAHTPSFRGTLRRILAATRVLKVGENLMVTCLPLLHRRSVSLLLVLASHFGRFAFVEPHEGRDAVLFVRMLSTADTLAKVLAQMESLLEGKGDCGLVANAYMPIAKLVADPTYKMLCAHNISVLKSRGLQMLRSLPPHFSSPSV